MHQWYRLSFLAVLFSLSVWSQTPGSIPKSYMGNPAIDLVYQDQLLIPEQAHELVVSHKGKFDLSLLNPKGDTDLWSDTYPVKLKDDSLELGFNDTDQVVFQSFIASETGNMRFNVIASDQRGVPSFFTFQLGRATHSILATKALLEKIGYKIPAMKRLPRVVLKFKTRMALEEFKRYFNTDVLMGDPTSWIVEELNDNKLIVQDLIVTRSDIIDYNLAFGPILPDLIRGRRLLSSLIVPLSITEFSDSINMMSWNSGIIENKSIKFFVNDPLKFQASFEDAKWIARRIEKLNRSDWEEIVEKSDVPKIIQLILVEKLISRRNSVLKLLDIDHKKIKVDPNPTHGVELVRGKVISQKWPGYSSRFAYGDPESPLSDSEMKSWIKSKAFSTAMDISMSLVNDLPFMGTDIVKKNESKFQEIITQLTQDSVASGSPKTLPLKSWIYPTYRGQILLSRNIVTGTYLGTDSLVQLADIVGVSVSVGAFVGVVGLPTPLQGRGGGELSLVRTYAHLKPVTSVQKAMKYPFKNILVPLVKNDFGKKLLAAMSTQVDDDATQEEKDEVFKEALKPFKDLMEVGESILVTDTLATFAGGAVGAGFKSLIQASFSASPGATVVHRFHVHRAGEDLIHVYKDIGHSGQVSLSFGLNSLIPIAKIDFRPMKGSAKTKYYSVSLSSKQDPQKVLEAVSLIRKAIVNSSVRDLKQVQDPLVIDHKFRDQFLSSNLLVWQYQKANTHNQMTITLPEGAQKTFRRHYWGYTKGKNFQNYTGQLITRWVDLIFKHNLPTTSTHTTNPGFSFKGKGETKLLTYDVEENDEGIELRPFIKINRIFNGWSLNKDKAIEVLRKIEERYKFDYFDDDVLAHTAKLYMYNISVNHLVYENGIKHLLSLTEAEIKKIFARFQANKDLTYNPVVIESDTTNKVNIFLNRLNRYRKLNLNNKTAKSHKLLLKALNLADERLNLEGLSQLVGGEENLYSFASVAGFREGDENGDKTLVSNSFGSIGAQESFGPLISVLRKTGMLEGEFFLYWMLSRLI